MASQRSCCNCGATDWLKYIGGGLWKCPRWSCNRAWSRPMSASEFLVRVRPLPDGGFEATCQPVDVYGLGDHGSGSIVIHHSASDGQGATPLAAMIAAVANSQVQDITQTQEGQDA